MKTLFILLALVIITGLTSIAQAQKPITVSMGKQSVIIYPKQNEEVIVTVYITTSNGVNVIDEITTMSGDTIDYSQNKDIKNIFVEAKTQKEQLWTLVSKE